MAYRQSTKNEQRDRLIEERDELKIQPHLSSGHNPAEKEIGDRLRELDQQIKSLWAEAGKG